MPHQLLPGCNAPGCPDRSVSKSKCARHLAEAYRDQDDRRGSSSSRGYGHRWTKTREEHLRHEPLCRHCLAEGRTAAGEEVDHIVPKAQGGEDACRCWADGPGRCPLQTLCKSHHSAKTAREVAAGRSYS